MRIEIKRVPPCFADPDKIRVKAELGEDVSELLPYLNSIIKGAIYNPGMSSLTFKRGDVVVTLYPREADLAKVSDEGQVREILGWIEGMVESEGGGRAGRRRGFEAERGDQPDCAAADGGRRGECLASGRCVDRRRSALG